MMNHFGFLNLPSIRTALIPMSSSTRKKKAVFLQPSPIREQIPFKLPFRMERRPLTPFPIQQTEVAEQMQLGRLKTAFLPSPARA